jgi:glycogen synthase
MACNFSWDRAAERYEELYLELIGPTAEAAA